MESRRNTLMIEITIGIKKKHEDKTIIIRIMMIIMIMIFLPTHLSELDEEFL